MSKDQAALKSLTDADNSSWRRALPLSELSGRLPEVATRTVGIKALAPLVPTADNQGAKAKAKPIPMATLAQFGLPIVDYTLDEESTLGLPVEVAEIIDESCVRSPKFEVDGTVVASGPIEELSPGPLMPEVHKGEGEGDIVDLVPPSIRELKTFLDLPRLGRCPSLRRSTLLCLLKIGLVQWENLISQCDKELSHRDQTLVDQGSRGEGRPTESHPC
ncbi:hypothetical protein Nepgr_006536 [Nepenthes gracilis]|uniref:Uncharacterized protein n=1 Tax=Nepenthes gracilis TaxID=150966 RepID=A0AAD3XHP6_NEPGR|nr:hypothetical protein Nepgr_006536 [Nepenthes gracilis]